MDYMNQEPPFIYLSLLMDNNWTCEHIENVFFFWSYSLTVTGTDVRTGTERGTITGTGTDTGTDKGTGALGYRISCEMDDCHHITSQYRHLSDSTSIHLGGGGSVIFVCLQTHTRARTHAPLPLRSHQQRAVVEILSCVFGLFSVLLVIWVEPMMEGRRRRSWDRCLPVNYVE